jgi:hypothetical protein
MKKLITAIARLRRKLTMTPEQAENIRFPCC